MIELIKAGVFDSSEKFKNKKITPERVTECYEIELYISGEGETNLNSVAYPHEKGNLIFARRGDIRFSKNRFFCFYVHINPDKETCDLLSDITPKFKVTNYEAYKLCYTEIFKLWESDEPRPLLLQSKLYELLEMIIKDDRLSRSVGSFGSGASAEGVRKAVDYINENYMNRITLKKLAETACFSPIYFHKVFTALTGKTPHEFLTEKRFEAAKVYLLTTDMSLGEIVDACGFSSHSYFDFHFKKTYGITPSQFRKKKYTM